MGVNSSGRLNDLYQSLCSFTRYCMFRVLSMGPIPDHIAFIMDGNRRYAKKNNFKEGAGHRAGFSSLISVLKYCYEVRVKYVTVYAFSIDNFKRRPNEVKELMDLILEKIEELLQEESIVHQYGIRVYFIGNLKLLSEPVRVATEKVMKATVNNTKCTLLICIAYTSRDEIVHAVEESCRSVQAEIQSSKEDSTGRFCEESGNIQEDETVVKAVDIEKHMYMAVAPEPDVLIRSSGETRLSNFLLWQSSKCLLYSPEALWPEIGLWHLIWAVVNFQQHSSYLEKNRKES